MCGILGIINFDGQPIDKRLLTQMTRTLAHRGPDAEGYYIDRNIGLGHRRLSIIDLESGQQPMSNEDETVWIIYNGEIYNFKELRHDLKKRGHLFRTNSDTEVVIHAYEEWGEESLARLRGMFAFGVLDRKQKKLFMARDRVGIKPLVYYSDGKRFAFASELKAILSGRSLDREIDLQSVNDYFDYGYIPAPKTILKKFYKLQPGHFMTLHLDRPEDLRQIRYWKLPHRPNFDLKEPEIIDGLMHHLKEAVRVRLISDVPLGAFLSGGIDSSTVVAMMTRVSDQKVKTFSIGFDEKDFSEIHYSRVFVNGFQPDHSEYFVKPDIRELLPQLVYHFDEPFADASAIPTFYVSKIAREKVTVALSGDGGDEVFAGYKRYNHCIGMGVLDFVPYVVRRILFSPLIKIYPSWLKGRDFIRGIPQTSDDRFLGYMANQYGPIDKKRLFVPDLFQTIKGNENELEYLRNSSDESIIDPLARYLDLDLNTFLPNDILTKVDITSMMNSLEVRVPILDHVFLEFISAIPSSWKFRNGNNKYVLKKAMRGILPQEILMRGKKGFGVPIRTWLTTQLQEITHEYLLNRNRMSGFLDSEYVEQMVQDNERLVFQSTTGGRIWWILFFEMWYRDVFNK